MSFFTSVEFYIIMTVVAAAIVIASARPRTRRSMSEYLLGSTLSAPTAEALGQGYTVIPAPVEPQVEFRCNPDGTVTLVRRGLQGVRLGGAVSLAVRSDGIDVNFEERIIPGREYDAPAAEARFNIDFLPEGWYNVMYNSDSTGLFVAFKLHVRPGLVATRELSR